MPNDGTACRAATTHTAFVRELRRGCGVTVISTKEGLPIPPSPFHESHAPLARALRHRCPALSRTVSRAHPARLPRGPRARARRGPGTHLRGQTYFMGRPGTAERCVRGGV